MILGGEVDTTKIDHGATRDQDRSNGRDYREKSRSRRHLCGSACVPNVDIHVSLGGAIEVAIGRRINLSHDIEFCFRQAEQS